MAKKKKLLNKRGRSKQVEKETLELLENYIAMKHTEEYIAATLRREARPTVRVYSHVRSPNVLIDTMNEHEYIHHPKANLVVKKRKKK